MSIGATGLQKRNTTQDEDFVALFYVVIFGRVLSTVAHRLGCDIFVLVPGLRASLSSLVSGLLL